MSVFEQIDRSEKQELLEIIEQWMKDHPNPYSRDEYEDAYWTIRNVYHLVQEDANPELCKNIFKRYYHKYRR